MLVFLGILDLLVLEGRLVKPDVTSLVGILKNDLLVILFKLLLACDMCKLANLAELITSSTLHTKIVARGFSFEPREKPLVTTRFRME
jgi:hypothetical protein